MHRKVRRIAAIGFIGCGSLLFTPLGCAGGIGPVRATQRMVEGRARVPPITVERLKGCMSDYGEQLGPGYHAFHPVVKVDEDGYKQGVRTDDIPMKAYDFAACTRIVLRDMRLPANFYQWVDMQKANQSANAAKPQRTHLGIPVVVVGAAIVFSELVLEAGAYTIMFAITMEVVDKTAKDVAEMVRRIPRSDEKDSCQRQWENCINYAPSPCLRQSAGKSFCTLCWERCNAGDFPSSACRTCGF